MGKILFDQLTKPFFAEDLVEAFDAILELADALDNNKEKNCKNENESCDCERACEDNCKNESDASLIFFAKAQLWTGYLNYVKNWIEDHESANFYGMSPICFDEWSDAQLEELV